MSTFSRRLAASGGRPSGFDYLRIGLALAIFVTHAFSTSYGKEFFYGLRSSAFRPVIAVYVPMFFALSGFLISGALERSKSMISFLGMRALRIYPALIAEVILSAWILGPLVTVLPLHQYFTDHLFRSYFLNVLGDIHYWLPGVFLDLPSGRKVNSQLWTIPFELECYVALALLAVTGIARRRALLLAVVTVCQIAWAIYSFAHPDPGPIPPVTVTQRAIVFAFLWGVVLFAYRDRVPWSLPLFVGALALGWFLIDWQRADGFCPLPIAYVTVFLGLYNPSRWPLLEKGDYSYGIYLFGIPIQQGVASLGLWAQSIWVSLAIAGPLTALFAAASWHLLEKRVLAQRPWLQRLEQAYLRRRGRFAARFMDRGVETAPRPEQMVEGS